MHKQVALLGLVISSLVTVSLIYSFGWIAAGVGFALGLGAMLLSMGGVDEAPQPQRMRHEGGPTTFMGGL